MAMDFSTTAKLDSTSANTSGNPAASPSKSLHTPALSAGSQSSVKNSLFHPPARPLQHDHFQPFGGGGDSGLETTSGNHHSLSAYRSFTSTPAFASSAGSLVDLQKSDSMSSSARSSPRLNNNESTSQSHPARPSSNFYGQSAATSAPSPRRKVGKSSPNVEESRRKKMASITNTQPSSATAKDDVVDLTFDDLLDGHDDAMDIHNIMGSGTDSELDNLIDDSLIDEDLGDLLGEIPSGSETHSKSSKVEKSSKPVVPVQPAQPPKRGRGRPPSKKLARLRKLLAENNQSSTERVDVQRPAREKRESQPVLAESISNNDYCDSCGKTGEFVCCETCPRSFHYSCAEPPVDSEEVEQMDHWYCKVCLSKTNVGNGKKGGPFSGLIYSMSKMNPQSFGLPDDIKRHFRGIHSNDDGDFVADDDERSARPRVDGDSSRLEDDQGRTIFCHKCSKTALRSPILACDFCPLYWHLDCVSPPLTDTPPANRKWLCPAHAEPFSKHRVVRQGLTRVIPANPNFKNGGDISVQLSPELDPITDKDHVKSVEYHVPEETIKLSFHTKVLENMTRAAATKEESQIWLMGLARLHQQITEEVCGQAIIKSGTSDNEFARVTDFDILREAASAVGGSLPAQKSAATSSNVRSTRRSNTSVSREESLDTVVRKDDPLFRQFMAWKRLMELQAASSVSIPQTSNSSN
eukprot:Partr_v1_DN28295_c0_g1_i1_m76097 putative PHD finger protein